jgi:hypothetical protein
MSCNNELYKQEEKLVRDTYLNFIKDIDNIKYIIFDSDPNIEETYYSKEEDVLHIKCDDSLYYTYEKNIELFKYIRKNNIEFDYLVRTNCSTFINIPLLNEYLTFRYNNYKHDNRVCHIESHIKDNIYMITGKFMIFTNEHIDILTNNILKHSDVYFDDIMFSKVLQDYYSFKDISEYDLSCFNILPSIYLNDIPTRLNNFDINKINDYNQIKNIIVINCKPYKSNDLLFIQLSFIKLYNIIKNGFVCNENILTRIHSFNNLLFTHNQDIEKMFFHKPKFNILLIDNNNKNFNANNLRNYIMKNSGFIQHIYIYSNKIKPMSTELFTIQKIDKNEKINDLLEKTYNICEDSKINYRYFALISDFIDVYDIFINSLYKKFVNNIFYNLLEYDGVNDKDKQITVINSNIKNLNANVKLLDI